MDAGSTFGLIIAATPQSVKSRDIVLINKKFKIIVVRNSAFYDTICGLLVTAYYIFRIYICRILCCLLI